jgi:hypothetical protein
MTDDELVSLFASYLAGSVPLADMVTALKQHPLTESDEALIGIDTSFLTEDERERAELLLDSI